MSRPETRRRLYGAAVELIAEQGFTATTVDAIAERAGVAKGTVFYNFGSKEGLFAAVLEHGIERLSDAMAAAAEDGLDAVVMAQLRFFDEFGPFARVLVAEVWQTAWQDAVVRLREGAIGVYERVLKESDLPRDFDAGTAATALFGMVLTVSIERRALHPERPLEQTHATLTDLIRLRIH